MDYEKTEAEKFMDILKDKYPDKSPHFYIGYLAQMVVDLNKELFDKDGDIYL